MAKEDSATLTIYANTNPAKKSADGAVRYINARKAEPRLSLGKINADFTKFQDSLDSATARVIAFTATTSLIYGVGNAFTRLTQDAIKIESVMTRIQSIFGSTASDTKRFQTAIFDLANGVGLSFYQVAEAAEEFSRQGLSLNKTLEATRAAAIVAKLSGAELKGVIEGLTATLSTFSDGTLDYIQVANKLVALDSAFATTSAGIAEGLKRVSGVAAEAGLSFDQTAAAITALKQVTGRSEAVIGNSLKSIFTSLQTEKVQKDLSTLGVETKDASGEFRNLIDVLSDLSKVYQTLGDSQKAVIAQKIGKTYQANAFQGILRTFETGEYGKAISISENAGSSAEDRIEKLNKTTEAALTRFGNNITKLGGNLGDKLGKPLVEKVAGYFNNLIEIANTTFGDSTIGNSLINGLKNVLEGPGVAIIAITLGKLLARITREAAQAVKSVAGITGRKENILEIEKFITQNLSDQNVKELEKVKNLDSVAARQKAILSIMQEQLAVAKKNRFASPLQQQFGVNLGNLDATKARKVAKKIPNRAVGDPAVNEAMIREAIDIQNGVGGARSTAVPQVKTLNLGRGPEKVVVNSDERIIPNFAGSGQHAILNREMMGYARGKKPRESDIKYDLDLESKRLLGIAKKKGSPIDIVKSGAPLGTSLSSALTDAQYVSLRDLGRELKKEVPKYQLPKPRGSQDLAKNLAKEIGGVISTIQKSPSVQSNIPQLPPVAITESYIDKVLKTYQNKLQREKFKKIREGDYSFPNNGVYYTSNPQPPTTFSRTYLSKGPAQNIANRSTPGDNFLREVVSPLDQNVIAPGFVPAAGGSFGYRNIEGMGVSRPKLPKKLTPQMLKTLTSLGYDKNDIKKMGVREAFNILNPGSDFSKAPIGSSSLGGTPATKVQVTQPPPSYIRRELSSIGKKYSTTGSTGGVNQISASLTGGGGGGLTFSDVRAGSINTTESPRGAFYRERQAEFSRAQARAEKISKVIDKGGILTNSAKNFIKSNPSLFSESQISKEAPSRGGISQRIGSGIRGIGQNAVGAGLGISFVGGMVAGGLKKDGQETQFSRAVGGISQSVGLGAIAGIFGATAGGIGLIAGTLVGLNEAFGENLDSLNGLSKSHEKLQEKYQKESRAINSYVENFSALADAISSGSQEAAKAARANISASLSQVEDKSVVNKLLSAGSVRDLSGITNDINSQRERELAGKEAVSFAAKLRQENRRTFLGLINGRNYAPGASTSELGDIIAKSIDYSKLPKNFTESDLPEQAREAIKIFSDGFKGSEIILDKIRKQSERVDAAQKIPDKISKIIESSQAQFGVIKGVSQKASFEILNQQISRSLSNSISEINLDSAKSSISDSSYARSKFLIDRNERYNKYSSDVSGINQTILDKAVELTKDKTFSYEKLGQIKSSFSGFSENGDIKKFLDSFGSAIGTDSKELNQFAQNQFLELRKLNAEFLASSKIAQAQQNALLSEIKKNSLLKLFGGGARYDKSLVSGGIGAVIGSPVRNKYDVNRFGLDAFRRKTYTRKQYAEENSRVLGLNSSESERGLSTIKYLYENGYYGIDNPNASPEIKALRESRLSSARKKAAGFFENISRKNAEEDTLLQTGRFIEGINKDEKLKTGSLIFGGQEKSDIAALIKEGSSESLKEAASYVGNILGKSGLLTKYPVNSDEFNRMNDLMTFLLERSSEIGNISESSKLQAETLLPSQTETQKQTELLDKIQIQESIANENLSHIASLIAEQDARMQSNQRLAEYNAAKLDVSKLEAERMDSYEAFGSLVSRYNESNPLLPKYEGKDGIEGFKKTLMNRYDEAKKAGSDTTNLHSMIKESRNIRSLEDITSEILDKRKILEALKSTLEKAAPKLNDFPSGSAAQPAQLSININSSESSIYSSDEFKSELKDFIVEYTDKRVNKKIKDNLPPGRRFVDIPDGMLA